MLERKSRRFYLGCSIVLILVETVIALFVTDSIIRPYVGDILATILVYSLLMSITRLKVVEGLWIALTISIIIELLQALQLLAWLNLENKQFWNAILGSSFSWIDMAMYAIGIAISYSYECFKPGNL